MSIEEIKKEFEEKFLNKCSYGELSKYNFLMSVNIVQLWQFIEQHLAEQKAEYELKEDYYQVALSNARIDRDKSIDECIRIVNAGKFLNVANDNEKWVNDILNLRIGHLQALKEK
jgi:hypothetical protein